MEKSNVSKASAIISFATCIIVSMITVFSIGGFESRNQFLQFMLILLFVSIAVSIIVYLLISLKISNRKRNEN